MIGLFGAQAVTVTRLGLTDLLLVQVELRGQAIQLVQFQPQPFGHRAVQLGGAHQRAEHAVHGALEGQGHDLPAFLAK